MDGCLMAARAVRRRHNTSVSLFCVDVTATHSNP
jgi:hypothetical protein